MRFEFNTTIEIDEQDVPVEVTAHFEPGTPKQHVQDPDDPRFGDNGTDDAIEVHSVLTKYGTLVAVLSPYNVEKVIEEAYKYAASNREAILTQMQEN